MAVVDSIDPIIDALSRQADCYRRLAKLAAIQHEHVQQNQVEALLGVLQNRQEVLDQIASHERVIAPAKKNWVGVDVSVRSRAEDLMAEIRVLLEEITTSDRNDALVLQQRKLNLGKQLGQAQAAKQVNRSYAAAAYGGKNRSTMDLHK
jgi:hypothetical protein